MSTDGSYSSRTDDSVNWPRYVPDQLKRRTYTSEAEGPPGPYQTICSRATAKLPAPSIATDGSCSSSALPAAIRYPPFGVPSALTRWNRTSELYPFPATAWAQAMTNRPSPAMAMAGSESQSLVSGTFRAAVSGAPEAL